MKNRILLIIGLVFVVVGVVFANLVDFALADVTGFAVVMFGAGLAAATLYNKRNETKATWMIIVSMVLVGIGAGLLGFGGFVENTMTTIIASVFGIVSIIAGLIVSAVSVKKK